ncbi:hypothetical protein GN244_ATG00704 [Phytophthora infestans]|uniref:Uncharacterized protein n=1 Tax=Phytophthora infestans TaxID=4787 RepID=A0A833SW73_PHYIN|nr:hypothetical protein GN244_ATG00704 [Phytophthora infestans]KAF4134269.1 hypothetical protein GN958_ATG16569 [Phytophthora infestans]
MTSSMLSRMASSSASDCHDDAGESTTSRFMIATGLLIVKRRRRVPGDYEVSHPPAKVVPDYRY